MIFKFCPDCGKLLEKRVIGDEGEVPYCVSCSRPLFSFSYPCVICLVTNGEGQVVLIKQSSVSLNHVCVAGYIKRGETAEETAAREVGEETGLSVESVRYIRSYYHSRGDNLMLGFVVKVGHGEFALSGEVDSAAWYTLGEARELLSRSSVAKELLRDCENLLVL